jgi:hypothetical protein
VGGDLGTHSAESVIYPTVAFLFLQSLHDGGAIGQVPSTSWRCGRIQNIERIERSEVVLYCVTSLPSNGSSRARNTPDFFSNQTPE